MGLKDFYEDKKFVLGRLPFIQYSAIAVFVFLFLGIWNLQILKSKYYKEQAEKNQVRSITLTAPRGKILDRNGLQGVPVEPSPGGPLSDHYDPRKKSVHLSEPVYAGNSVASAAIAAHEVGHAIQHQKAYTPFRLRSAMWPAVSLASNAWLILLMIGLFAQIAGLMTFAVVLYAVVVLFQLVTLPVEFDASRRAMSQLKELGLVTTGESQGARKVLTAAAMTYVAAALAALSQLAYWLIVINNR